jgi:hypothetical protein
MLQQGAGQLVLLLATTGAALSQRELHKHHHRRPAGAERHNSLHLDAAVRRAQHPGAQQHPGLCLLSGTFVPCNAACASHVC